MVPTLATRRLAGEAEDSAPRLAEDQRAMALRSGLVLLGSFAVIALAVWWGNSLLAEGTRLHLRAPPLYGHWDWRPGARAMPAIAAGAIVVGFGPVIAARLRWRAVLGAAGIGAVGWALALALIDGMGAIAEPLVSGQYLPTVARVGSPGQFLATFTDRIASYTVHTQGHPPGMVMVVWLMDRVGLGGRGWNAVLVFSGGAVAVMAALVAAREIAGERTARIAAPFLVLAPAAVAWSSGDPFFAGVGAAAVTAIVLATGREGRTADAWAVGGGALFVATAYLSYGLVLLAVIPVVVAIARHRYRPLVIAALTGVVLVGAISIGTGFLWWEGLGATRVRYFAGVASTRPYGYFLLANIAAFLLIIGPATIVGATRMRMRGVGLLVLGAVAAVAVADISGMSKAETERIWLPFVPWVMLAGVALASRGRIPRSWLAVQASAGLILGVAIRAPW